MLGRARRSVTVIDAGRPRNRFAPHMHGLLSRDGASPLEFLGQGRREAAEYGVEFVEQEVQVIDRVAEGFLVRGPVDVLARRVVIATGLVDHLPEMGGLDALWGTGAVGCPYCDGWEVRGQALGVIATSPMSRNQAQLLRQWTSDLTIFGASEAGIAEGELIGFDARGIKMAPPAVSVHGELGDVTVTTAEASHNVTRVFVAARPRPSGALLEMLGCASTQTPAGPVVDTDTNGRTSVDGVWAIGNVADIKALVPIALGAGTQAALDINISLVEEEIAAALDEYARR